MEKITVSKEGLEQLKTELAECRARTPVIAKAIDTARDFGDLKENAEYHAARDDQAMLQARIRDIEHKIAHAVVLDEEAMDDSKALMGAHVKVLNRKTNKEMAYKLVSPVEADMGNGKISVRSPVGLALLGKEVGDIVKAQVPAGVLELEVVEISR
jgi:transcription elongation factor GreA